MYVGECIQPPRALSRHIRHAYGPAHVPSKVLLASGDLDPSNVWLVPWTHTSEPLNGTLIGSAVFAKLTYVPNRDTQTHIQRYERHLYPCTACRRCCL